MKTYKHETDHPAHESIGSGTGGHYAMHDCTDFKKQASDQAYGQSGKQGIMSDSKKINQQFFHSYTDDTGY